MPDGGVARLRLPVGERDHVQGPAGAPVTLVEYGDYECPYCRAAVPIIQELQGVLGDQLRYVFRHFPLADLHPHAQHAAETAEAAAAQGQFFEMHAALFEHQEALEDEQLVQYAVDLDLDAVRIRNELAAHAHAGRVREDFESGQSSDARGTPTGSSASARSWRQSRKHTPTSSARARRDMSDNAPSRASSGSALSSEASRDRDTADHG